MVGRGIADADRDSLSAVRVHEVVRDHGAGRRAQEDAGVAVAEDELFRTRAVSKAST